MLTDPQSKNSMGVAIHVYDSERILTIVDDMKLLITRMPRDLEALKKTVTTADATFVLMEKAMNNVQGGLTRTEEAVAAIRNDKGRAR